MLKDKPPQISVRNTKAGGDTRVQRYRMTPEEAAAHCKDLIQHYIVQPGELVLDESAPDHLVTLHAEVWRGPTGLEMRRALDAGVGMRPAFSVDNPQQQHVSGLRAVFTLREYLDAPSYDCLQETLEHYPDSVNELSAYRVTLGVLNWNTVFWECRNY
jgi:hypothetical protein